jgi:hypothetical protein
MLTALQILQALALHDPDYPAFSAAISGELHVAALPPALAEYIAAQRPDLTDETRDVIAYLRGK